MRILTYFLIILSSLLTVPLYGQDVCDVEVSGVLAYCNSFKGNTSNTIPGFFIGFRIKSENGDTLNVVDLAGNVPMNLGKRIDDINVEFEPADTSRAPVRIAGRADSLEYWYFGPFTNGDSFNIVLIDRSGLCDTVEVASGTFNCQDKDPNACDSGVPLYYLDFSLSEWTIGGGGGGNENVDQIYLVMQRSRVATCCQTSGERCFEFIITLDEDDIGLLVDDVGNGSPGGSIYADSLNGFACGTTVSNTWPYIQNNGNAGDDPICLSGSAREWIVLSCKQGNNVTGVSFGTVGELNVLPEITYADCAAQLEVLNASSAMWSSIDDPELDNFTSLGTNNLNATFLYNEDVFGEISSCSGDTFIYFIAGFPDNACIPSDSLMVDTTFVIVYPPFSVSIDSTCMSSGDSILLEADIHSYLECNYEVLWSTGDTSLSITVPNEPGTYNVSVSRPDIEHLVRDCSPAFDAVVVSTPAIQCSSLPNLQYQCLGPVPPPDIGSISVSGCGINPIIYVREESNNGIGCPADPLIITRHYIADFDGDTLSTVTDKDTCSQTFTFVDNIAPSFTCPPNVVLGCLDSTLPPNTTSTDNCDQIPGISYNDQVINGPCIYTYTINRQWSVIDDCGNTMQCVQIIQVRDLVPPQITCPANITLTPEENTLPVHTGMATSIDNCDPLPEVTYLDSLSLPCADDQVIVRKWIANDACGNTSVCAQRITISNRGEICGVVLDENNDPLINVEIELIRDSNGNQSIDIGEPVVGTTATSSSGAFCFQNVVACDYVLREIQPPGYLNLSDFDISPDPDGDDSEDGPDNQIPVTLLAGESDIDNHFVDNKCPLQLPIVPSDTICDGEHVFFQLGMPEPGFLYSWNFGISATPSSGLGTGPHDVTYEVAFNDTVIVNPILLTISKAGCPDLTGQVASVIINTFPDPSINASIGPLCYFTERQFKPLAPENQGATYQWTFGNNAVPATATGYGPHNVYYTASGSKSVTLVVYPNDPGASCIDSSGITFLVFNCPANITGKVLESDGDPIQGVNLQLFADADTNGLADTTIVIRNVFTNSTGVYSMASIVPGHYIISQVQPPTWSSFDDFDSSEDMDIVINVDPLDNIIPVTLIPSEIDSNNVFVEVANPGNISGAVFKDPNNNQIPDNGEGISGVIIEIFEDDNKDGIADSGVPLDTAHTGLSGSYAFSNISPGNYVLVEQQPATFLSIKDFDASNDQDSVPNTNMLNDTLPVTLLNQEQDLHNYFIEEGECSLMVINMNDSGLGSLRYMVSCASPGDTITFHQNLAGETIFLTSEMIDITKDVVILSALDPRVRVKSTVPGLFNISNGIHFEINNFDLIGGLTGLPGAALNNFGMVKLEEVTIHRNEFYPESGILIYNHPGSQLTILGTSKLMMHYD